MLAKPSMAVSKLVLLQSSLCAYYQETTCVKHTKAQRLCSPSLLCWMLMLDLAASVGDKRDIDQA